MYPRPRFLVPLAVLLASACAGPTGPEGQAGAAGTPGATGPQGPAGPAGPITAPPTLTGLSQGWGSAASELTVSGTGFDADPSADRVFFGGLEGTVTAATPTTLTVQPSVTVAASTATMITVEVANQMSNAVAFELVPAGTPVRLPVALPDRPVAVTAVGGTVYVAASGRAMSGLYARDPAGKVTRVLASPAITQLAPGAGAPAFDAPTALATDGTVIFYALADGTIHQYDPATGADIVRFGGIGQYGSPTGLVYLGGSLFTATDSNDLLRLAADGTLTVKRDPRFDGQGQIRGLHGIATDGTSLYLTNMGKDTVIPVTDPNGTLTIGTPLQVPPACLQAQAIVSLGGSKLVVGCAGGGLLPLDTSTGTFGTIPGRVHETAVDGCLVPASGTASARLLFATPDGGEVAAVDPTTFEAAPFIAGLRTMVTAAALSNGQLYLATADAAAYSTPAAPDGSLVEVAPDGSSRLVAVASAIGQMTVGPDGLLYLTDEDGQGQGQVETIDPASGAHGGVLTLQAGRPWGVTFDAAGDLFATVASPGNPVTLWRQAPDGTRTPDLASLPGAGALRLATTPSGLLVGPMLDFSSAMYAVGLAGTPVTQLTSAATLGLSTAFTVTPGGGVFVLDAGYGLIYQVDPSTGAVSSFGSALVTDLDPSSPTSGVGYAAMSSRADGTLLVADGNQDAVIAVAP